MTSSWETDRIRLGELLAEAAELEHALLCQYLFAAFSFKRSTDEGVTWEQLEHMREWEAALMLIARQEMEHLGLVCNMLTAIGEAPHLRRPNLPLGASAYGLGIPLWLQRFCAEAVARFALFEVPAPPSDHERAQLDRVAPGADPAQLTTIAELYGEIRALFATLDGPGLFIGPPGAQLTNEQVIPSPVRGIHLAPNTPVYDFELRAVTNLASAEAAIDQIILEGEGSPGDVPTSHFARFCAMYVDLEELQEADPDFDPARPVIENPNAGTAVTPPSTRAVMDLFDLAYDTLLLLLIRFFAQTDESDADLVALQHVTFFPMMTAVIRPLGELLTQLPAGSSGTAGPTFRIARTLDLLPHRRAAWRVIEDRLILLGASAGRLAADPAYPPAAQARLALAGQNLERMASDFAAATGARR